MPSNNCNVTKIIRTILRYLWSEIHFYPFRVSGMRFMFVKFQSKNTAQTKMCRTNRKGPQVKIESTWSRKPNIKREDKSKCRETSIWYLSFGIKGGITLLNIADA